MKQTAHMQPVRRLRMSGAVPPLVIYLYGTPKETFTFKFTSVISHNTANFKDNITLLLDGRMNVERSWYDLDKEKSIALGVGPVDMPLCQPSIPHVLAWRFAACALH